MLVFRGNIIQKSNVVITRNVLMPNRRYSRYNRNRFMVLYVYSSIQPLFRLRYAIFFFGLKYNYFIVRLSSVKRIVLYRYFICFSNRIDSRVWRAKTCYVYGDHRYKKKKKYLRKYKIIYPIILWIVEYVFFLEFRKNLIKRHLPTKTEWDNKYCYLFKLIYVKLMHSRKTKAFITDKMFYEHF